MGEVRDFLRTMGLTRAQVKALFIGPLVSPWILVLHLNKRERRAIIQTPDPIRFGTLLLALRNIEADSIPGSLAECGVAQGTTSRFIHRILPDRRLYLFDTFAGFDLRDEGASGDQRFKDTSVARVLRTIGDDHNIVVRQGYFPGTTHGLENESFAFAMIDFDKYDPTFAALDFFYPRLSPGGYLFIHDHNSTESGRACYKALTAFLADKPERPIGIPDSWGTAVLRKV